MAFFKKILVAILTLESRLILRKYKPFVVAVTGSVGKTSTKDAIYSVLKSNFAYARKTEKSMNSEFGLPLTIIGVPNAWHSLSGWISNLKAGFNLIISKKEYPDCLVLEVGADHPGDISRVAKWLHPDIAVITLVSRTPVHVEFFKDSNEVFEEKASLINGLKPSGTLVLYGDDEKVLSLKERALKRNLAAITFGLNNADVKGLDYKVNYQGDTNKEWKVESGAFHVLGDIQLEPSKFGLPKGCSFAIEMDGKKGEVTLGHVLGQVYMYPILAAAACAKVRNISLEKIIESLKNPEVPKGRLNIIEGVQGTTIIDDTYNSSPDASIAALDTLKSVQSPAGRVAILGDMMELGMYSADEHKRIGEYAAKIATKLITVGPRSKATAESAIAAGLNQSAVISFDNSNQASENVSSLIKTGDIILIKGSQSVRMERVVKALMAEPEKASDLLVRQEKEWLEKK